MCQNCLDLLNGCIMFREMCQKNNKRMLKMIAKEGNIISLLFKMFISYLVYLICMMKIANVGTVGNFITYALLFFCPQKLLLKNWKGRRNTTQTLLRVMISLLLVQYEEFLSVNNLFIRITNRIMISRTKKYLQPWVVRLCENLPVSGNH